jgi:hypothetical protein
MEETCSLVDSLLHDVNENSLIKVLFKSHSKTHALEHMIHQASISSGDMSRSCEHIYSKMLQACAERDEKSKKLDPLKVLNLISKITNV